jgi:hypothetical protein
MPPNPIDHLEREQAFSCSLEFFRRALAKRAHAEIEVAEQRRDLSRISQWNTHLHRNTLWTLSCRQPWKTSASRYHRMASSNAAEVDVVALSSAPATTMTSPCGTDRYSPALQVCKRWINDKSWLIDRLCSKLLLWQIGHRIQQSHEELR